MELLKKISFYLFVAFVLFLFVWALFIPKTEISQKIAEAVKSQTERADLAFKGVTVQEIVDGIKYWEIKAKTSNLNEDKNYAILKETNGTFFEKDEPGLKFISPEILWQIEKKEIEMKQPFGFDARSEKKVKTLLKDRRKNIFALPLKNGQGYYFKAEKLKWKLKDKKISCQGNIWIRRDQVIGFADSLTSDVKLSRVLLGGNPYLIISSPQKVRIEADYFEVDSQKDTIHAKGDVIIKTNNSTITAPELNYNQSSGIVTLKDNVLILYKGSRASGKTASYNTKRQLVILKEQAKLEQEGSSVTGEIITYSLKTNKFDISGRSRAVIPEKTLGREIKK
ncbi:MAG: LPS export ABC transporter periplasmic protein LptC [Candidatus Saganbacteria bacterium]|nr:LPS export ABC transporter periplasmic protein LptC [Candidatus Saganbacteria bacterium]